MSFYHNLPSPETHYGLCKELLDGSWIRKCQVDCNDDQEAESLEKSLKEQFSNYLKAPLAQTHLRYNKLNQTVHIEVSGSTENMMAELIKQVEDFLKEQGYNVTENELPKTYTKVRRSARFQPADE
jgi:hypothetical protein